MEKGRHRRRKEHQEFHHGENTLRRYTPLNIRQMSVYKKTGSHFEISSCHFAILTAPVSIRHLLER